jgi:hypothetical protein
MRLMSRISRRVCHTYHLRLKFFNWYDFHVSDLELLTSHTVKKPPLNPSSLKTLDIARTTTTSDAHQGISSRSWVWWTGRRAAISQHWFGDFWGS